MNSALYEGTLRHRRFAPRPHEFRYRLFMVYLDLAELDEVFRPYWLWSVNRANLACFMRRDYLGDARTSIDSAVRDSIEQATGIRPCGPIRVLTHLRYFGYLFNPVSFYYCFEPAGNHVETILAEITNTPWQERHSYVLSPTLDEPVAHIHRYRFHKNFHVSPFFPINMGYDWRFSEPDEKINIHMRLDQDELKMFDATMTLERREINSANLAGVLLRYPLMTLQVVTGIYWQATLLKFKKIPVFDHPGSDPGTRR